MLKPHFHATRKSALLQRRRRRLRFDVLEERRLMAGVESGVLDVLVFEDSQSNRLVPSRPIPAAERVVFVDINRDGFYQSNEPSQVTGDDGIAHFEGLSVGRYEVRLLANQRTTVETTSTQPEETGTWSLGLGVQSVLEWESESVAWFTGRDRIERWDLAKGVSLGGFSLGGKIESVVRTTAETGAAIVQREDTRALVTFDRATGEVTPSTIRVPNPQEVFAIHGRIYVRGGASDANALYRMPSPSDRATDGPDSRATPVLDGFDASASLDVIGRDSLLVIQPTRDGSVVSTFRLSTEGWQLSAERYFNEQVQFASAFSQDTSFAIQTSTGIAILNNTLGLPVIEVLEQATGPTAYDASRGILFTQLNGDPLQIVGWATSDWSRAMRIERSGAGISPDASMAWSMGYLKDTLVGIANGNVYRHGLTSLSATTVAISEGVLQQIAIGIRTRTANQSPQLNPLSSIRAREDEPVAVPFDTFSNAASDAEGDTLYYMVRRTGELGRLEWSATSFGTYVPAANRNGSDVWTIQAFDGTSWSLPQELRFDITAVNDVPSGMTAPSEASVPEMQPGAEIADVSIADPDADALYRFVVSDGRFTVVNGKLALAENVALDFEAMSSIVLTIRAVEVNEGDTVAATVTVRVQDRNDPPIGIMLTGNGSVPENISPYVVGNIGVIDPDRYETYDFAVSDARFEVAGNVVRVKPGASITYQDPGWLDLTFTATSRSTGDVVRRTERLRVIRDETPYHNDSNPADVDGDGRVTPLDPLIIINHINSHGSGPLTRGEGEAGGDLDVDGDGRVSPLDILIVINAINAQRHEFDGNEGSSNSGNGNPPLGEGEGNASAPPLKPGAMVDDDLLPNRKQRRY